jgi:fluoroquinolone transport system permease protein
VAGTSGVTPTAGSAPARIVQRALRTVRALAPIDARSVARDPLLRWLVAYPIVLALLLRFGVAALDVPVQARFGFALSDYGVLIVSFVFELLPVLCGMVVGFLLLDARDDGTLAALQVTPLTLGGFLAYRLAAPMALSVAMTLVSVPLVGLADVHPVTLVAVALGAAPLAPLFALFLAAFARNKVEGFALTKAAGILFLPPVFAYFVHAPWQWAFGVMPTFWPVKALWLRAGVAGASTGVPIGSSSGWAPFAVVLIVGVAWQALVIAWLLGRFRRAMTS